MTSVKDLQQMALKALQTKTEEAAKKAEEATAAMNHWVKKVSTMVDVEARKAARMGKFEMDMDIRSEIVYRIMADYKHLNPKELGTVNLSTRVRFSWHTASKSSNQESLPGNEK